MKEEMKNKRVDYTKASEESKVNKPKMPKVPDTKDEEVKEIISKKKPKKVKVVNCARLNVRTGPSLTHTIAHVVNEGDILIVDELYKNDSWTKVVDTKGASGFILSKYVKEE